jgi:hypothetical protein
MTWIPIRIDFVEPGTQCNRVSSNGRHHGFPTGTATFLLDESSGQEYPFGPTCAGIVVEDRAALRRIPDFTSRDFSPVQNIEGDPGSGGGAGGKSGRDDASNVERDHAFAKRYLMLRMDRIANLPGIQPGVHYAPLAEIYAEFKVTRQLSDDQVRHIIALEKSEKTPATYRSNNLLDVYTAYVQLTRLIKTVEPGRYLDTLISIRDSTLLRRLWLSDKQIGAAKLRLHPQAFQS